MIANALKPLEVLQFSEPLISWHQDDNTGSLCLYQILMIYQPGCLLDQAAFYRPCCDYGNGVQNDLLSTLTHVRNTALPQPMWTLAEKLELEVLR